jgi:hypothetical protein
MTRRLHPRDNLPSSYECAEGVDPPCGLKVLRARLLGATPHAFAGVVDEGIDGAKFLMDRSESELDRQGVGGIAGNGAGEWQLLRQRLESFFLARQQHDRVAFLREFAGEGRAVARTRAHDRADGLLCRAA